jgi:late competence protein required for DNA uptake (superfamily II DNA/RNA helicase)
VLLLRARPNRVNRHAADWVFFHEGVCHCLSDACHSLKEANATAFI